MTVNSVKKAYSSPRLTEHGSVQRLTEGSGSFTAIDFFLFGYSDPFGNPWGFPRTGS
jgi:hypothetical protein